MLTFLLSPLGRRLAAVAAVLAALAAAYWWIDHRAYKRGAQDTIADFVKADRERAENVDDTAERILRDIDPDGDVDDLLRQSGGLRD